jgi:hypothetical protein
MLVARTKGKGFMSRSLRAYPGLWNKGRSLLDGPAMPKPQRLTPEFRQGIDPRKRFQSQQRLGELLLDESPVRSLLQLLATSLGLSLMWRDWSHQRIFALSCALQLEISEDILRGFRRRSIWGHYGRTSLALSRLLKAYAGERRINSRHLNLVRMIPGLFIWHFEKQLGALRRP